jgi:hypothetical protein
MGKPKIEGGYILSARKTLESAIMNKPPLYSKLWTWMQLQANHEEVYKGLKRGQFFTTIDDMVEAMSWHVGYRKKSPSKKQIRRAYEWFKRGTMIVTTKSTRGMLITILNYDYYQNPENYEGHDEGHDDFPTNGKKGAHYKQEGYNNYKNNIYTNAKQNEIPLKDGTKYVIPTELIDQLIPSYPHVNIQTEIPKMRAWSVANKSKRKTRKGMPRFINNWLSNAEARAVKQDEESNTVYADLPVVTCDDDVRRMMNEGCE